MFQKFDRSQLGGQTIAKSSVQRAIRAKVLECFPSLEPHMEDILPKKGQIVLVKLPERHTLVCDGQKEPLFIQNRDGVLYPVLYFLHRYPSMLPKMQVDRGGREAHP
jgi:Predicted RNA-binding protein (contains PUA domain)